MGGTCCLPAKPDARAVKKQELKPFTEGPPRDTVNPHLAHVAANGVSETSKHTGALAPPTREAEQQQFMVGEHVHIWSKTKSDWLKDGCVYRALNDGSCEFRYNEGEAAKTLTAIEIKSAVKRIAQSEAAAQPERACDIHRVLARKGRANESLNISENGEPPRLVTLRPEQAESHYVVYPITALTSSKTAEPEMYELWPLVNIEDGFAPLEKIPEEVVMRIQDGVSSVRATRWGELKNLKRPEAWLSKEQLEKKEKDGFQPCRRITPWDKVRGTRPIGSDNNSGRS